MPESPASGTTVFHNGTVLPVDSDFSEHSAIAIRDGRILAVGSDEEIKALAANGEKTINLDGRVVLPGFIEPHMHFALMAGLGHLMDIGAFKRTTFEDALEAIREIRDTSRDDWVMARQFDPILLEPPRDLTVRELDAIVTDRPVFILNASGHIAYVNSKTLEMVGITRDSQDPPGGEYGRFEDGSPNGVLYGAASFLDILLRNHQIADRMQSGFVKAGREVGDLAATLGITMLCDQATGGLAGPAELTSYRAMFEGGGMKSRIRAYAYSEQPGWDEAGVKPGDGDAMMRVAGWKIVTDGSNQGFTGRQREPYYTRDTLGIFYVEPEALSEQVLTRAREGWPLSLHGNGDAAIDSILDAVENARNQNVGVDALRCRIEHCSILHDDQIKRMHSLGMVPSFLIHHVHYWGHVMRDEVFGPEKVQLLDRCRSVEKAGLNWVMHTDAPVAPLGTLEKIRVAVARDLWKEPETILAPDERVSVEAAIRSVTRNAAFACHSEKEVGSLEPGKLADLVILEEDPRKVEPTTIPDIQISETWMNGSRV
ncbi:MAG: amidohydrolase [Xanthomonadales bacterium]|nr:amidohydrolase [Xanthomonadales bacterium]